jgi:hypothetical protein
MNRINRFKALEEPQDPTDYEDFEDIAPYNKLEDGKWTSLWLNRHPLYYKIANRFGDNYYGKLMRRELNEMKEEIEKLRKAIHDSQKEVWARRRELHNLIDEQEKLCNEDTRSSKLDTILLSAIDATMTDTQTLLSAFCRQVPEAMIMMENIVSFIPIETCTEKLQRHLDGCTGRDKCTKNYVSYDCRFKNSGRCSHYYEIQDFKEELERDEYYEDEDRDRLRGLEYKYERALAVKENRLEEFLAYDEFD